MLTPETKEPFDLIFEGIKALGLVFAACSFFLAYRVYRRTVLWNRISASFSYLSSTTLADLERQALAKLHGVYTLKRDTPLSRKEAATIFEDEEQYLAAKELINIFDSYSIAITTGALHPDVAYLVRSHRLIRHYDVFLPLIELARSHFKKPDSWLHIQIIAKQWKKRREAEEKAVTEDHLNREKEIERRISESTRVYG